jgi:hypothetical protein
MNDPLFFVECDYLPLFLGLSEDGNSSWTRSGEIDVRIAHATIYNNYIGFADVGSKPLSPLPFPFLLTSQPEQHCKANMGALSTSPAILQKLY